MKKQVVEVRECYIDTDEQGHEFLDVSIRSKEPFRDDKSFFDEGYHYLHKNLYLGESFSNEEGNVEIAPSDSGWIVLQDGNIIQRIKL